MHRQRIDMQRLGVLIIFVRELLLLVDAVRWLCVSQLLTPLLTILMRQQYLLEFVKVFEGIAVLHPEVKLLN